MNHAENDGDMTRSSCRVAESVVFRTRRAGLGLTVVIKRFVMRSPGKRRARSTADSGYERVSAKLGPLTLAGSGLCTILPGPDRRGGVESWRSGLVGVD